MGRLALALAVLVLAVTFSWAARPATEDSGPRLESKIAVNNEVRFTAFSPDGKIAGVLKSNKIGLWSITDGQQIQMLDFRTEQPVFADFLDEGKQLLVGFDNGQIQLLEAQTGKRVRSLENGAPAWIVRVSGDGKLMATTGANREIEVWDFAAGKVLYRTAPNLGDIEDLAFSPDGGTLASSADDTNVYLWDTKTGQQKAIVSNLLLTTFGLVYAPDGKSLYAGSGDRTIHVIEAASGKVTRGFPAQKYPVVALSMSPDGQRIAAVYRDANEPNGDTPVLLWNAKLGEVLQRVDAPGVKANGCRFLSNGRLLYSTTSSKEIMVWSLH